MRKLFIIGLLLASTSAFAAVDGTVTTTVTTATTNVAAAGTPARSYLFIQNLSASVEVTCTIGVSAGATTTTGIQLPAGASYLVSSVVAPTSGVIARPPNGKVDCIAASTTAPVTVISY